jgi:hypothetical protein
MRSTVRLLALQQGKLGEEAELKQLFGGEVYDREIQALNVDDLISLGETYEAAAASSSDKERYQCLLKAAVCYFISARHSIAKDTTKLDALIKANLPIIALHEEKDNNITLAARLDMEYKIYNSPQTSAQDKIKIGVFLQQVLGVNSIDEINAKIQDREAMRNLDPEYIPGKRPALSALPNPLLATQQPSRRVNAKLTRHKTQYLWRDLAEKAYLAKSPKMYLMQAIPNDLTAYKNCYIFTRASSPQLIFLDDQGVREDLRIHNVSVFNKVINKLFLPEVKDTLPLHEQLQFSAHLHYFFQFIKENENHDFSQLFLLVNTLDQLVDEDEKTQMLSPEERDTYRKEIINGKFSVRQEDNTYIPFDTSIYLSHNKKGYAAFVMNRNGEFSFFNHHKMTDGIAHSSMNAGKGVIYAGEAEIINGELKTLTNYSGHYLSQVENVFKVLQAMKRQGVNISQATCVLFQPIPGLAPQAIPEICVGKFKYAYNALDIFQKFSYTPAKFWHRSVNHSSDAAAVNTPSPKLFIKKK